MADFDQFSEHETLLLQEFRHFRSDTMSKLNSIEKNQEAARQLQAVSLKATEDRVKALEDDKDDQNDRIRDLEESNNQFKGLIRAFGWIIGGITFVSGVVGAWFSSGGRSH